MSSPRLLVSLLVSLLISPAFAQYPPKVATTTVSAQVAGIGTFQQLIPSQPRFSCTIQYEGAGTGFVYFGAVAAATTQAAFQLANKQAISCDTYNGLALTDAVAVTGTATADIFVVTTQP